MHRGQRGWDVAALQFLLQRRGYQPGRRRRRLRRGHATARGGLPARRRADGRRPRRVGDARARCATAQAAPVAHAHRAGALLPPRAGRDRRRLRRAARGGRKPLRRRLPGRRTARRSRPPGVGTTVFAGCNTGGYGNLVVIQHRLGYTTWYAHMSRITTCTGERVEGGTRIGYVGSTGHSTGPHLHFEVRLNNVPIDPVPYLLAGTAARAGRRSRRAPAARTRPPTRRAHRRLPLAAGARTRPGALACLGLRAARHRAQVERLVERLLVHALLERDLADRAPRGDRLVDDLGAAVVADVRVERGGDRRRRLGVARAASPRWPRARRCTSPPAGGWRTVRMRIDSNRLRAITGTRTFSSKRPGCPPR